MWANNDAMVKSDSNNDSASNNQSFGNIKVVIDVTQHWGSVSQN